MSIEMKNPKTALGKIDAAANYVEQMQMAHMIKDEKRFKFAKEEAARLLFEATLQLQETEPVVSQDQEEQEKLWDEVSDFFREGYAIKELLERYSISRKPID